jgi:hypothetical protein
MAWRVTYLCIRDSIKHGVFVNAASEHIARRIGWDAFVERRVSQRYPIPLKEDFALYSIVEMSDPPPETTDGPTNRRISKSHKADT